MPKKIWDMSVGRAVESSPGLKTNGEFSGLYRERNATAAAAVLVHRDAKAQDYVDISNRQKLNEGELFSGYLAMRRVEHVTLHIGMHPTHGLSAYVDRPTSHTGGRIEIVTADEQRIVLFRRDFFGKLLDAEIPESHIEAFCVANWHA